MRTSSAIALLAAILIPAASLAQQPAAPAAAPAAANAPKHACTKPDEYPGRLASESRRKNWNRDVTAYIDCMKKFIDEQKAQGDVHYNAAQGAITTINKEIQEFNAVQKE
jgi:hypothetical protein